MKQLLGTGVALVTPFTSENKIDFPALERLINYQIDHGVNYLVVLGTTAETSTLTKEEQQQVKDTVVRVNAGRLPLVVGIGGNNTQALIDELKSSDLSKFTAVLSVSPYYSRPTQDGIYAHFKAISEASPLPIIVYNIPYRTGTNMNPETVFKLANDFKNIIGIKEAAGNFDQALELLLHRPKDFLVISGEDKLALPLILAGGAGVISVIGQGFPSEFSHIMNLAMKGNAKEAFPIFYKLMPSIDLIFSEGNPAGIKALLQTLQICQPHVRLPLIKASDALQQKISNFAQNFKR